MNIEKLLSHCVIPLKDLLLSRLDNLSKKTSKKTKRLIIGLLVVFFILLGWSLYAQTYESTDNANIEGRIVPISTRVSGYVKKIDVKDNELLFPGQILLELDARDYELKLEKAKAALNTAIAQHRAAMENFETSVVSAPSAYESAKASYDSAQAKYEKASDDLHRLKGLNELTLTKRDLAHAIADEKAAKADLKKAEANLKSASAVHQAIAAAEAKVSELKAAVGSAEVSLAQAAKDLADTKIYAPYAGKVTHKLIEVGTYVQPGQSLFSIVGKDLWVVANFKESQVRKIRPGQKVDIEIDAFSDLKLTGRVDSIQAGTGSRLSLFPPENASGNFVKVVQRVPVKIVFDQQIDPQIPLAVGMSVTPIVRTGW